LSVFRLKLCAFLFLVSQFLLLLHRSFSLHRVVFSDPANLESEQLRLGKKMMCHDEAKKPGQKTAYVARMSKYVAKWDVSNKAAALFGPKFFQRAGLIDHPSKSACWDFVSIGKSRPSLDKTFFPLLPFTWHERICCDYHVSFPIKIIGKHFNHHPN
jgi:hypothetical protein